MRRRLILAIVALIAAAALTGALAAVMSRERDDALTSTVEATVLVATERIEAGTIARAAADAVTLTEVPESALVPGVLSDLESVATMRAVGPILPGQQIVAGQWSDSVSSPLRPPPGTVGIAVQLGDPQRVAGFITPGSAVAVFATVAAADGVQRTRLLMSPVTVLGVGSSTVTTRTTEQGGTTSTEEVPAAVLTLALTIGQAERVVFAATDGQLHLGLLGDRVRAPSGEGVTAASLFGSGA